MNNILALGLVYFFLFWTKWMIMWFKILFFSEIISTLCNWAIVGLDFDQALAQQQPIYKVIIKISS